MASDNVILIVKIKAKNGMEESAEQELTAMLAPTRAEAGCIQYDLHRSLDDKSLFYFYEIWADQKAFDEHVASPHFKNLLAKADDLFAGPLDIAQVEKLS